MGSQEFLEKTVTTSHFIDAAEKVGEGAKELLQQSGLWTTVVDWFRDNSGATIAAAAVPFSAPLLHVLAPVVGFLLYRNSKRRHAKAEADKRAIEEQTASDLAQIKRCLQQLVNSRGNEEAEQTRARLSQVINLESSTADFQELLLIDRKALAELEKNLPSADNFSEFSLLLRSQLDKILDKIQELQRHEQSHYEVIVAMLNEQSALLMGESGSQSRIESLSVRVNEQLKQIELLNSVLHEKDNNLDHFKNVVEVSGTSVDESYVHFHAGLAEIALQDFKYADALVEFRKASNAEPNDIALSKQYVDLLQRNGDPIEALEQVQRLAALFEEDFANSDARDSINRLAVALWHAGKPIEARAKIDLLLEETAKRLGPTDRETLRYGNNPANKDTLHAPAVEEHLENCVRHLGKNDPVTLQSMMSLLRVRDYRGQDALSMAEFIFQARMDNLGGRHIDTLQAEEAHHRCLFNSLHQKPAADPDSLERKRRVVEILRHNTGSRDPATIAATLELARTYFEFGQIADAFDVAEPALQLQIEVLGPEDPSTLHSMSWLRDLYWRFERKVEAISLLEIIVRSDDEFFQEPQVRAHFLATLAEYLIRVGKHP